MRSDQAVRAQRLRSHGGGAPLANIARSGYDRDMNERCSQAPPCGDCGDAPFEVRRGLPAGCEAAAAELYWVAFGRKLGLPLGPKERGVAFIAGHLNADRAVAVLSGEQLIGVAGFHHQSRGFVGGGLRDLLASYGLLSGVARGALLVVLERRERPGQLLMDGIAVRSDHRSKGVGRLLLREIADVARELGDHTVRLDVVDTNPRARQLYEREGFVATDTRGLPLLRRVMGFSSATTMEFRV